MKSKSRRVFDVHNHLGVELGAYLNNEFPYGQSLPELLDAAARNQITHIVVFPMVTYLAQGELKGGRVHSGEKVPYAFENRRMCDEIFGLFGGQAARVFPFAMFDPGREVTAQIRELRALKRDFPIYGLKTQPTIIQSKITALNEQGREFLELAQEWDVPMLIHSSVMTADIWSQAPDILDIAERWAGVRFNVAHSCRFDRPCLDRLSQLPNCWFDVSAHGIHCELATQESPVVAPAARRFVSDYARPDVVLRDLAEAYPRQLLWGSDSPYYSYAAQFEGEKLALLSSFERESGFFHALSEAAQTQVGWKNALCWLGINDDESL